MSNIKRIGVLTSGGDAPGMNSAIRAVVHEAAEKGLSVFGFSRGFNGLIDNEGIELDLKAVGGLLQRGGTMLLSARSDEFKTPEGRKTARQSLEKRKVDALVVIGGDGSFKGAQLLEEEGVAVAGVPATIDNDIYGTDMAIGVDTALNTIVEVVDKIKDTASSLERTFVIETMGRDSGYLALMSAIATGAEAAIIPEVPYDLEKIARRLYDRYQRGATNSIIIVAEGASSAYEISRKLAKIASIETKITVLGHLQRGGSPSAFDRLLGSRLGTAAVEALLRGESGVMVGLVKRGVETTPLAEVFRHQKTLDKRSIELAEILSK